MENVTVSLILWKYRPNKNGEYSIYLRFGAGAKAKLSKTGYSCRADDWNNETCRVKGNISNSAMINAELVKQLERSQKTLVELKTQGVDVNLSKVKEVVKSDVEIQCFHSYAERNNEKLRHTHSGHTVRYYCTALKKLKIYSPQLKFNDITVKFLKGYEDYLRDIKKSKKNTIAGNFRAIRRMYNDALKDKIIPRSYSPFEEYRYNAIRVVRTYLTIDEISRIESIIADHTTKEMACRVAAYFIFSCYSGLRFSDALKFNFEKHVVNNRLIIKPGKGIDSEIVSLPIHPRLKIAIERIQNMRKVYENAKTNRVLKDIAKTARIDKRLTFHVARHTFAMECANRGMSIETVSILLGHKDIKTTSIYYKVSNQRVDREMLVWE